MNKLALSSTEILFHIYLSSLNTHFLCIYLCYSILYIITVYTSYTQYSYSSKFKLSLRSLLQRTISIFSLPHSLLITWVTLVQLSTLIKCFFPEYFIHLSGDPCIGGVCDDPCRLQLTIKNVRMRSWGEGSEDDEMVRVVRTDDEMVRVSAGQDRLTECRPSGVRGPAWETAGLTTHLCAAFSRVSGPGQRAHREHSTAVRDQNSKSVLPLPTPLQG